MKALFTALFALAVSSQSAWASGDDAFLFMYDIDRGQTKAFSAGYKAHLQWHADHADTLPWYGWFVTGGDNPGRFVDGSFGVSLTQFDQRPDTAGDGVDFSARVAPFAVARNYSRYRLWRGVSTAFSLEDLHPTAQLDVWFVDVAPADRAAFESALEALAAHRVKTGLPWTWYRPAMGSESYLLLAPRDNWAGADGARASVGDLAALAFGVPQAQARDLDAHVRSWRGETWTYQADLSRLP